ncbi:MAG: phosphopantetheine-binding protein [Cytophagales bacterium]|nr:phosphopantetheine-binding protein [Cytophagales bacterium]
MEAVKSKAIEEVRATLANILVELKFEVTTETLTDDLSLIHDIGLDSLQMINFFLKLEDEFDLEVDFDDIDYDKMSSVSELINYLLESVA